MSLPPSTYGESGLDLTASPINLWQRGMVSRGLAESGSRHHDDA